MHLQEVLDFFFPFFLCLGVRASNISYIATTALQPHPCLQGHSSPTSPPSHLHFSHPGDKSAVLGEKRVIGFK